MGEKSWSPIVVCMRVCACVCVCVCVCAQSACVNVCVCDRVCVLGGWCVGKVSRQNQSVS